MRSGQACAIHERGAGFGRSRDAFVHGVIGDTLVMRPQFGDDCSGPSSCCASDDVAECALSCTTLNSKLSSCSAACSSAADCLPFAQTGETLQCIQVARKEQLEQRDVSFAVAVVIAACVLGVLALGYCALLRDKGGRVSRSVCAACLSLAAIATAVVVVSHHAEAAAEQDPTNVHLGNRLESVNATHFPQRFCAPHSLLWVVGVSMALAGSVAITFGTQLQKLAFNRQERAWQEAVLATSAAAERGEESTHVPAPRKPWFKLPLWWAGYVFLVIGAFSDFAAVGFAAQSLLAPLAAASLIINSIQAPCLLGEIPTLFDVFATLVICAGCTVSVVFAEHSTRTYSLDDMLVLLTRPLFCTYLLGLLMLMVHVGTTIRRAQRDVEEVRISTRQYLAADPKSRADTHTLAEPAQAEDDAEQGGVYDSLSHSAEEEAAEDANHGTPAKDENGAEEIVPLDAIERSRLDGSNRYAVYYAVLAGQCGGLTMLFAKMLSEIVRNLAMHSDHALSNLIVFVDRLDAGVPMNPLTESFWVHSIYVTLVSTCSLTMLMPRHRSRPWSKSAALTLVGLHWPLPRLQLCWRCV